MASKFVPDIERNDFDSNFRQLLIERRQEIEERTLASSERGLGLLYESEKVRFSIKQMQYIESAIVKLQNGYCFLTKNDALSS